MQVQSVARHLKPRARVLGELCTNDHVGVQGEMSLHREHMCDVKKPS